MQDVNYLLDKSKDMCKAESDGQLATQLKVSRQRVSNWRKGHNAPDAVVCAKIAEITGLPLARVLGIVGEARAISTAEKAVWRQLAQAAAVVLVVGATLLPVVADANLNDLQTKNYAK